MVRPQLILDLNRELIVDNFAGGGGASLGIEQALGRSVDIAINHDPIAVAVHRANHPQTHHYCEDVWQVDPVKATAGRPVGLAWFSPDCKDFSKAKGGKPRSKKIRGLAWVVIKWAALKRPRIIVLENVEEFQEWGPLLPTGERCPKRKGSTFKSFVKRLQGMGYAVEWRELRACDYGAPTIRKRLYLIARCDGRPVVWPQPTHADPRQPHFRRLGLKPWRTAAECIDWSLPCHSIFLTKDQVKQLGIKCQRPLAESTMRRLAKGVFKFVIEAKEPFIVSLTHQGGDRIEAVTQPLRTITGAQRGEKALAIPFVTEHANASNQRNLPVDESFRTMCAEVKGGHFALVASFLSKFYGTNIGQRTNAPIHSVTAQGNHIAEVRAFLTKYYGQGGQDQGLTEPIHTIPTLDRFGLVVVAGVEYAISDIAMRMLAARELYRGQGFPDSYIIDLTVEYIRRGKRQLRPLCSKDQIRLCGNSVCPDVAEAIVAANAPDLAVWRNGERRRLSKATSLAA